MCAFICCLYMHGHALQLILASISACACILCFMYAYCAQVNDSECNSLEHTVHDNGHTVKGYALFGGPTLTGRVTFVSIIRQMLLQESCMCYSYYS